MALIFGGDDDYEISGPAEWAQSIWGLDQLVIPYRGAVTGLEAFLTAHPPGEASPIDGSNMFLMQKQPDGHLQFPTVRMVYQGKRGGTLPPQKHGKSNPIQSATSSFGRFGPAVAPATIQYQAPTNTLSYITRAAGTTDADDPTDALVIRNITLGSTTFSGTSLSTAVANFFSTLITAEINSEEVVPGQYWQNVAKKTKQYVPFTFDLPSGTVIVTLAAPGASYQIGDTLTITGTSGSGVLQVTALGLSSSIIAFITISASFTAGESALVASGGTGTGAAFNVIIIA